MLVQEKSVNKLDGDMNGLLPLVELLSHLEYAVNKSCPLLAEDFGHDVVTMLRVLDVVVELVSCLVLEHLGQELCWRNISVKLLLLGLDGSTLILENHRATSFAILEFHVVSYQCFAVDECRSQII